ncbi:MAG: response regulator [Gemmatimonadota bacterium]
MTPSSPPPDSVASRRVAFRRTGLAGALAALESLLGGLAEPAQAEEAHASVDRILHSLLLGGAFDTQTELRASALEILAQPTAGLAVSLGAFTARLSRSARAHTSRDSGTVLIVEDDSLFAKRIESALDAVGCRVRVAATAAEARRLLQTEQISLLVLDLILPDGDGRSILLELRSDPRTAALPVFVVSARLGTQTKAECFALGADAYFDKPVDVEAFSVAVEARLERNSDQTLTARRDPVTGLPNRAAFLEAVARLRETSPAGTAFSLAVLDLDHFRWIAETWGRQFSDSVLRRAGVRLALALRQAAVFARWDGAEFIALFTRRSPAEAGTALEQALGVLRRIDFRPGEDAPLTVTFSAGVAEIRADEAIEDAIAEGDRLRYVAKESGRNRVVSASGHDLVPIRRILLAEDDPNVSRLVSRHLRNEGFDVVTFPDGEQALANAPSLGLSLIVSDLEMPKLDGLGFLRGIRQHPELRHLPVMMLTAMGDESYIVRAFELGADDYVLKPFSMREVTARMRRLLHRPSVTGIPVAS